MDLGSFLLYILQNFDHLQRRALRHFLLVNIVEMLQASLKAKQLQNKRISKVSPLAPLAEVSVIRYNKLVYSA